MKAQIFFFTDLKKYDLKYSHLQEIPAWQVWEIAKEIYDKGLNVMIYHSEERPILFVDTKRFQQR